MSLNITPLVRPSTSLQFPSRVTFEGSHTVCKVGDAFRVEREVEAMEYVGKHTTLPIPEVREVHLDGEDSWFRMEQLPGSELGIVWHRMADDARANTISGLKTSIQQLHQLRPPAHAEGHIASISGGPVWDHRLSNMSTCGPFSSISDFHDFLVAPVRQCPRPEWADKYRARLPDIYDVRFSHADLSWENILVDVETGKVEGILDWEMAGFWPEWWEYRKALFGGRSQIWWMEVVEKVMVSWKREADLDMDLEMY